MAAVSHTCIEPRGSDVARSFVKATASSRVVGCTGSSLYCSWCSTRGSSISCCRTFSCRHHHTLNITESAHVYTGSLSYCCDTAQQEAHQPFSVLSLPASLSYIQMPASGGVHYSFCHIFAVDTITLVYVRAPRQWVENPQTATLTAAIFDPCCTHYTIAETGAAYCKHILAVHTAVCIFAPVTERPCPRACTHCCGNSL